MDKLTTEDLQNLIEKPKERSISLFMPTHRVSGEAREDIIRFKNLLKKAEKYLLKRGLRTTEIKELLEPAQRLLDDHRFWQNQNIGLSVFVCPTMFRYYCLPTEFDELVVATDRFHIKPLLSLFTGDGKFYLLVLSQKKVQLFRGTRYSMSEVNLEGVPQSISEVLRYDDPEKQLQFHIGATETTGHAGRWKPIYHGHGIGTDDQEKNILRFFQAVDRGLHELLKEEKAPLVLAGVEYLFPIYTKASSYPCLIEEGVRSNLEELGVEELHKRAWSVVEPVFQRTLEEAIARYGEFSATARTSSDIEKVIPAAYYGRVESLLVAAGLQKWGTFVPNRQEVVLHDQAEPGDEDLLDFAAVQTLINKGTVYVIDQEIMPERAPLAAMYRY